MILCIVLFVWEVVEEVLQIYYTYRRINGHRKWLKVKQDEAHSALLATSRLLTRNAAINHSESLDVRIPAKYEKQKGIGQNESNSIEKQKTKYLQIEKDIRAINSAISPYTRVDNVIDWITASIELATLVSHFIDIGSHSDTTAKVHICISVINVIVIWLRQILIVNGIIPATNLVCMLRLMGKDILRFAFLFIRLYIPFVILFWALYSGEKVSEDVMSSRWQECEYINYEVPYTGPYSLNRSLYGGNVGDPFNCTNSISVSGFEDFYNTLYSVFRIIVVDNYDFDNMKLVHSVMSPIICSIYLILSSIIGVNFFIGLMSNVLSDGAFNQVESHKSMELLGYVLQKEWRLSIKQRQSHLDMIRKECSPKVLTNDEVVSADQNKSTTSSSHQTNDSLSSSHPSNLNFEERLAEIQAKLEKDFLQAQESNIKQNETLDSLKSEIGEIKSDMSEIKNLLKRLAE